MPPKPSQPLATSHLKSIRKEEIFNSKYGDITKYNGDNFADWKRTCSAALASSDAYQYALGEIELPRANAANYDECKKRVVNGATIIYSSVAPTFQLQIHDDHLKHNVKSMWTIMLLNDNSSDAWHDHTLRTSFHRTVFDPTKLTLMEFVQELESFRAKLSGTIRPLQDEDIRDQLLFALPHTPNWTNAKSYCIDNKPTLQASITYLQERELPATQYDSAHALATDSNDSRGRNSDRGKGRARRGRSRRGRFDRTAARESRNSSSHSTAANSSRVKKESIECYFCSKKGHKEVDCQARKRMRKEYMDRQEGSAHITLAEEQFDTDFHCSTECEFDQFEHCSTECETALLSLPSTPTWVIDSGASHHFTGDQDDLQLHRWQQPRRVTTASGQCVNEIGYGNAQIGGITLEQVWLVPAFNNVKLVSVKELTRAGYTLSFNGRDEAICRRSDANSGSHPVFTAQINGSLYTIPGVQTHPVLATTDKLPVLTGDPPVIDRTKQLKESDVDIWHRRLAHTNFKDLFKLQHASHGIKLKLKAQTAGKRLCQGCLAGKMREQLNKSTAQREIVKGRSLHMDTSGRIGTSVRGFNYELFVIDEATREMYTAHLNTLGTDEVFPQIEAIMVKIRRSTGNNCAIVRADNGKGEFGLTFQNLLIDKGIEFKPCPAYKHSFNGVVERSIYTLDCKARSLLYEAGLPPTYWCYALEHACWVKNRVPTSALPFDKLEEHSALTPHEAYLGGVPNLSKLAVFGCLAVPINTAQKFPKKYDNRSKDGTYMFVGLNGHHVFKLLNLQTNKIEKFGDVRVDEYRFPYSEIETEINTGHQLVTAQRTLRSLKRTAGSLPQEAITRRPAGVTPSQAQDGELLNSELLNSEPVSSTELLSSTPEVIQPHRSAGPRPLRLPHRQSTRSGRVPVQRIYDDIVTQRVVAMKAVQDDVDSASLGAPTSPLDSIGLQDALAEDAPGWKKAIYSEFVGIRNRSTYTIMRGRLPLGRKLLPSTLVLRKKFNSKGEVIRRKARLCVRGDQQSANTDYFETFASVVRYDTFRFLMAFAAQYDLEIDHIDVDTAFLNPKLNEPNYMRMPALMREMLFELHPELKGTKTDDLYLKLNKALYGLKQAPREWFLMVKEFFNSIGLTAAEADPNLFVGKGVYLLLFVDDMLIIRQCSQINPIKSKILRRWECKDLSPAEVFVGFQIERKRSSRTLKIHQGMYVTKLLERLKMDKSNPVNLPMPAGSVLSSNNENLLSESDAKTYRTIVGSVLYLTNGTRPDIAYATGQLARFMSKPAIEHFKLSNLLLRYLNGTRKLGITYSARTLQLPVLNRTLEFKPTTYFIFTDATWATESDRVSFQGVAVLRYGGVTTWIANRQKFTALSSMEAEIMAASEGGRLAAWLEKLTRDLKERDSKTPYIPISSATIRVQLICVTIPSTTRRRSI